MRYFVFILLLVCSWLPAAGAESDSNSPFESTYLIRTGERLQGPHQLAFRMTEYSLQRGRWILPDFGYYDIGALNDRVLFTGVGAELVHTDHVTWTQVLYAAQESGSAAHHERTVWVWPVVDARLPRHFTFQTALYPTVPLNQAARWGFDIERAKVEHRIRPYLKAGAGYSACVGANTSWTSKPFATATVLSRAGAWEFWLQRVPGGAQVQLRFSLSRKGF